VRSDLLASVYLQVDMTTRLDRMVARDGASADPEEARNRRYEGAWERYTAACDPAGRADVVVDNTDLAAPWVIAGRG
jgi:uridine kinase